MSKVVGHISVQCRSPFFYAMILYDLSQKKMKGGSKLCECLALFLLCKNQNSELFVCLSLLLQKNPLRFPRAPCKPHTSLTRGLLRLTTRAVPAEVFVDFFNCVGAWHFFGTAFKIQNCLGAWHSFMTLIHVTDTFH